MLTREELALVFVAVFQKLNYPLRRGEGEINTLYTEGMYPDGTLNANTPDQWNDGCYCFIAPEKGPPSILGAWDATTEPGAYWTQNPMHPDGAARIAFGPQTAWKYGEYHDVPAWRQEDPIYFYRDPQRLYKRYGKVYHDVIGVHHHTGYDFPRGEIRRAGAGCQVRRLRLDHEQFMRITCTDPGFVRDREGFRLTSTVIEGKVILSTAALLKNSSPEIIVSAPAIAAAKSPNEDGYHALWTRAELSSNKITGAEALAKKIASFRDRYEAVEKRTGVPWFVVGAIHNRESSLDFATHLHNGDSLVHQTVHVPRNRPPGPPRNGQFYQWDESADDALAIDGLDKVRTWSVERALYECEKYNGMGYEHMHVVSPYDWSWTSVYRGGKYVADGRYDASAWDSQAGCAAVWKALAKLDPSVAVRLEQREPKPPKDALDKATEKPRAARTAGGATASAGGAGTVATPTPSEQPSIVWPLLTWSAIGIGVVLLIVSSIVIARRRGLIAAKW